MLVQSDRSRMSVEDYLRLDSESAGERYEYVDGYAYMLAGGTADHSTICVNVTSQLNSLLATGAYRVYNSDMKVRLSETRYVYPDATVSCDERDRGTIETLRFPLLIIEVLSTDAQGYDRGQKFDYYRECATLEEYVLIDTQRRAVDVYRRAKKDLWTLHFFRAEDSVELTSLNVTIPLSAIYRNVALPPGVDEDE